MFNPDYSPKELKELGVYKEVYGGGKQLASMDKWPAHWIHPQDPKGWLQWYERYSKGRRTEDDDRQIKRWKSFKARHGAQFAKNPTPRRAYALQHWAIDPTQLVEDKDKLIKAMDTYKEKKANALTRALPIVTEAVGMGRRITGLTNPLLKGIGSSNLIRESVGDATSVNVASLAPKLQGLGLGRKMYGAAIRDAFLQRSKYPTAPRYFTSDSAGITSNDAARVWQSLQRRGYPVQTTNAPAGSLAPQFKLDLDQMKGFYKDKNLSQPAAPNQFMSWLKSKLLAIKEGLQPMPRLPSDAMTPMTQKYGMLKEALKTERKQYTQTEQVSRQPSAVIIQGNQDYIRGNHAAKKFYADIAQFIRERGYTVTTTKGEESGQPPGANVWVSHGGYNPPKGTKVLNIPQYPRPFMTKALIQALGRATTEK